MTDRLLTLTVLILLLFPSVSLGADRYVCIYPNGYDYGAAGYTYSAGYTSMSAAEAAEVAIDGSGDGAGTWDGDTLYFDILHGSGANTWDAGDEGPDTTAVEVDGWECLNDGKLIVRTMTEAAGDNQDQLLIESRPDFSTGTMDTSEYLLKVNTKCLELDNDHDGSEVLNIEFIGIQFETHTGVLDVIEIHPQSYYGTITFNGCWVNQTVADYAINVYPNTTCDVEIINCVLTGNDTGTKGITSTGAYSTTYVYNTSVFEFTSDAYKRYAGTMHVIACCAGDCGDDIDGPGTTNYNCTDDGDGTNPIQPSGGAWGNELTTAFTNLNVLNTGNIFEACPLTADDDIRIPAVDIAGKPRETDAGQSVTVGAYEFFIEGTDLALTSLDPDTFYVLAQDDQPELHPDASGAVDIVWDSFEYATGGDISGWVAVCIGGSQSLDSTALGDHADHGSECMSVAANDNTSCYYRFDFGSSTNTFTGTVWFHTDQTPTTNGKWTFALRNAATEGLIINHLTDGTLRATIRRLGGAEADTTASAIALDTWHRLDFVYDTTGGVASYVKLNGTYINGSSAFANTPNEVDIDEIRIGAVNIVAGTSGVHYFDDIAFRNGTTELGSPGALLCALDADATSFLGTNTASDDLTRYGFEDTFTLPGDDEVKQVRLYAELQQYDADERNVRLYYADLDTPATKSYMWHMANASATIQYYQKDNATGWVDDDVDDMVFGLIPDPDTAAVEGQSEGFGGYKVSEVWAEIITGDDDDVWITHTKRAVATSSTTATVWCRLLNAVGTVKVRYGSTSEADVKSDTSTSDSSAVAALAADDYTVHIPLTGLSPKTQYWYKYMIEDKHGGFNDHYSFINSNSDSDKWDSLPTFTTPPTTGDSDDIAFVCAGDGHSGGTHGQMPWNSNLFDNLITKLTAGGESSYFGVEMGDEWHSSVVSTANGGMTLANVWSGYRANRGDHADAAHYTVFTGYTSMFELCSDHNFGRNNTTKMGGANEWNTYDTYGDYEPIYVSYDGFRDYVPLPPLLGPEDLTGELDCPGGCTSDDEELSGDDISSPTEFQVYYDSITGSISVDDEVDWDAAAGEATVMFHDTEYQIITFSVDTWSTVNENDVIQVDGSNHVTVDIHDDTTHAYLPFLTVSEDGIYPGMVVHYGEDAAMSSPAGSIIQATDGWDLDFNRILTSTKSFADNMFFRIGRSFISYISDWGNVRNIFFGIRMKRDARGIPWGDDADGVVEGLLEDGNTATGAPKLSVTATNIVGGAAGDTTTTDIYIVPGANHFRTTTGPVMASDISFKCVKGDGVRYIEPNGRNPDTRAGEFHYSLVQSVSDSGHITLRWPIAALSGATATSIEIYETPASDHGQSLDTDAERDRRNVWAGRHVNRTAFEKAVREGADSALIDWINVFWETPLYPHEVAGASDKFGSRDGNCLGSNIRNNEANKQEFRDYYFNQDGGAGDVYNIANLSEFTYTAYVGAGIDERQAVSWDSGGTGFIAWWDTTTKVARVAVDDGETPPVAGETITGPAAAWTLTNISDVDDMIFTESPGALMRIIDGKPAYLHEVDAIGELDDIREWFYDDVADEVKLYLSTGLEASGVVVYRLNHWEYCAMRIYTYENNTNRNVQQFGEDRHNVIMSNTEYWPMVGTGYAGGDETNSHNSCLRAIVEVSGVDKLAVFERGMGDLPAGTTKNIASFTVVEIDNVAGEMIASAYKEDGNYCTTANLPALSDMTDGIGNIVMTFTWANVENVPRFMHHIQQQRSY